MQLAHGAIFAIVAVSIAAMLVRPRGIAEVWWAGAGAILLVVTGLVSLGAAGRAIGEGTDVYLFLVGMMVLAELARAEGVFDWLAAVALRRARGSAGRLFALVYGIGTVVTIFMSNDATAVVLTPAILAAVRRARVAPLPHLFACAFIANAASFVLPISNPANIVVYHAATPPLATWLAGFALPSVLSIAVTFGVLRFLHRASLREVIEAAGERVSLGLGGRLVIGGLAVVTVVLLAASARGMDLGRPTCAIAMLTTIVICVVRRRNPIPLVRAVSWLTIGLVAALFIMVDAVRSAGALSLTSELLRRAQAMPPALGAFAAGGLVGVGNNVVNNLPLGLLVGATMQKAHVTDVLLRAILVGIDLGPNLSITGSLATILWLLMLRREGVDVGFLRFLRVGVVVMPLALIAAIAGILAAAALGG